MRFLTWLFNPVPLVTAVRVEYRRGFRLAMALFVVSGLVGFLVDAYGRDHERKLAEDPAEIEVASRAREGDRSEDTCLLRFSSLRPSSKKGRTREGNAARSGPVA